MLTRFISIILVNAVMTFQGAKVNADSLAQRVDLSGTLESELALGAKIGNAHKVEFILTPEFDVDLTSTTQLTVIARLGGDLLDELDPQSPEQPNRSAISRRYFVGDSFEFELREAYIDSEIGSAFIRLGKQQVVWGQADGLKVLDVLNPQSYREFILDDFDDSRIPLWMVNAEIPIGETMLQLLWIPDRTYDDIPAFGAAFAFTSPLLIPEVPADIPIVILPPNRPDKFIEDSDVAAKFSIFAGGWDLSLNYAFHYVDRPVLRREISSTGIAGRQQYERTHLLGTTFSTVFSDFTFRGEVGYSSDRYFLTNNPADQNGVDRATELSYVLGLDYQGWRDWFVSAQIFQSILNDTGQDLVRADVETTATLLVRRDFMNDSLQAEMLLIQNLNQHDGVIQTSLNYEYRSNIRLKAGADIFYGSSEGLFGQFKENDRISIGVEFGF